MNFFCGVISANVLDQMNLEETTCSERMEQWVGYVEETLDGLGRVLNTGNASRT